MELIINSKKYEAGQDRSVALLSFLRDKLDLTGSKYGCGEGVCGACTVLVDGKPTRSCITSVGSLENKRITTIEGIEENGKLHPIQEAFLKEDVFQCGYCATGMVITSYALLDEKPNPTAEDIISFMNGNICRCGTYARILAAIREASATAKKD